tara:strand:- start:15884 stop:16477 length:594 start_codon:yes stop_codon:yes gene_type:complete
MNKVIYSLVFLIVSGLLITALILYYQPSTYETEKPTDNQPAIYESMSGVTAWQYNNQGKKTQSLKMSSWKQFVKDPVVYMTSPTLKVENDDGSLWEIESQFGQGTPTSSGSKSAKFDKVMLLENVQVLQTQTDATTLHLKTEELTYQPEKQWVSSKVPVTVTRNNMHLQANSLFAELDKKMIQFSGQVNSIYEKENN